MRLPPLYRRVLNPPTLFPLDSGRGGRGTRYGTTRPCSSSTSPPGALDIHGLVPRRPNVTAGVHHLSCHNMID
ncbi:hypothetical protein P691DRAFT_305988 [Macrolepiota fuliginosa MF-IS2]|uniref:Uncharacterized protein n=1 Tax=Macrolepiota fuliginosa MF-IS2 TaxID=1400762 RepID=A0A9P5X7Y1_9AGAR|nr:hypothetical protein P691DRAFT_305988 [Macrolepiota fuliginosa MF-IS2]